MTIAGALLLGFGSILPVRAVLGAKQPLRPVVASAPIAGNASSAQLRFHVAQLGEYSLSFSLDEQTDTTDRLGCLLGALQSDPANKIDCSRWGRPVTFAWALSTSTGEPRANGRYPIQDLNGRLDDMARHREVVTFTSSQLGVGDYLVVLSGLTLPEAVQQAHPAVEATFENEHYDYYKDWNEVFATIGSGVAALQGWRSWLPD